MFERQKIPCIYEDATIKIFSPNLRKTGGMTFIIWHKPTREVLVIDFGIGFASIKLGGGDGEFVQPYIDLINRLRGKNKAPLHVLLTHGHYDHVYGVSKLAEHFELHVHGSAFSLHILATIQERLERAANYTMHVLEGYTGELAIGPFRISYLPAVHSMPQTRHYVIETPHASENRMHRVLFGAEFRIQESSATPGLSQMMLEGIAAHGPYDVILYDGLRHRQAGFTPPEDVIRPALRAIFQHEKIKKNKATVFISYIASKYGMFHAIASELTDLGHLLDVRGGAMRRMYEFIRQQGWVTPPPVLPDEDQLLGLLITGSQNEPGSFLNRLAEGGGSGEILPTDFFFVAQGAIPFYVPEIRVMYQKLAVLVPQGGIIIPRAEQRRLQLQSPHNNIYILEEFTGLDSIELSSGHGKAGDQEYFLNTAQAKGPAGAIIGYQLVEDRDRDIVEDVGDATEVPKLLTVAHKFLERHFAKSA